MKLIELLEELKRTKKSGEIGRFKYNNVWYLIEVFPEPYKNTSVYAFNVYASRKSSKNRDVGIYSSDKVDKQYSLGGGDITSLKEIIKIIANYLETWKPELLGISAFSEDNWAKRMNFYMKVLGKLGYEAVDHYDRKNDPGTLVFAKKGKSKRVFVKAGFDEERDNFYFETSNGKRSYIF